jgi:hypothetical protein
MERSKVNPKKMRLASATVGAGAVLAMGAFGVISTSANAQEIEPAPPGPVTTSEVTTGETVTQTVAPEAPETTAAEPPITTDPTTVATVTP